MREAPGGGRRWAALSLLATLALFAVILPATAPAKHHHKGKAKAAVRILTADQASLIRDGGLTLSVKSKSRGKLRIAASGDGGDGYFGTKKVRFRRKGKHRKTIHLALTSAGRSLLSACGRHTVDVAVRRGKKRLAAASAELAPDQSRCPKGQPAPETFRVGTAVEDITPTEPMYVGGYGDGFLVDGTGHGGQFVHDPLQVRAFAVARGNHIVVFESVDSQGWFAGYQSPNGGDGVDDARADAATRLQEKGFDASAANVVISSTHGHATPTIMGIWGHTEPAYLHEVKQAAVQAVSDAVDSLQPAELWAASGTIRGLLSQVQGTDQMTGYAVDLDTPVLWARRPGSGATIGVYANVPVHADQYDATEPGNNQFTADYPGYVRDRLAETLGGTSVVAMGTLGRQEGIGNTPDYSEVTEQGTFITNALDRALATARPVTDPTIAAGEQQFSTVAENEGLVLALMCNHGGLDPYCPEEPAENNGAGTWDWRDVGGIFTINRSVSPPYFDGTNLGTNATVARIGDQLYATVPGEAFPEVGSAIRRAYAAAPGIRDTHVIGMAGDQLGYYWDQRDGVYPDAQIAQSDFEKYNLGSHLAEDNVAASREAGDSIGLSSTAQSPFAELDNPNAFAEPTIQFYPNRVETTADTVSIYATAKVAQAPGSASTTIGSSAGTQGDGMIAFDYGDGTSDLRTNQTRFDHTFPGPGAYRVQASVTDNLGMTYRWVQWVVVDPSLSVAVDQAVSGENVVLTPRAVGGQRWNVLAAHWTFDDGRPDVDGTQLTLPEATGGSGTVTIVDGAGNTASGTWAVASG
ncbi:MAG TPA: hypothetical protein VH391_05770 [Solirubrobacterales bacterium]|jgi:hypothetical protein